MQRPSIRRLTRRGKVVLLERSLLPRARSEHVFSELSLELFDCQGELGAFADGVVDVFSASSVLQ